MFGLSRKRKPTPSPAFDHSPAADRVSALAPVPAPDSAPAPDPAPDRVRDSIWDSFPEALWDPALESRKRAIDDPHHVARDHSWRFLQWLIDTISRERNILVHSEIEDYYRSWCSTNGLRPRGWNMVGRYINRLLGPLDGESKPREPFIDAADGLYKKRRIYVIPSRMPADWLQRLGYPRR